MRAPTRGTLAKGQVFMRMFLAASFLFAGCGYEWVQNSLLDATALVAVE
jgi:hypothetical protein